MVADEPAIHDAARELQQTKVNVQALEADLATLEGVDRLLAAARGRPIVCEHRVLCVRELGID